MRSGWVLWHDRCRHSRRSRRSRRAGYRPESRIPFCARMLRAPAGPAPARRRGEEGRRARRRSARTRRPPTSIRGCRRRCRRKATVQHLRRAAVPNAPAPGGCPGRCRGPESRRRRRRRPAGPEPRRLARFPWPGTNPGWVRDGLGGEGSTLFAFDRVDCDCRYAQSDDGGQAAVHVEDLAIDEVRRRGGEEQQRADEFLGAPHRPAGVRMASQALNSPSFTSASVSFVSK